MPQVAVCVGSSEALFASLMSLVQDGDEVIILEPAFDLYALVRALSGRCLSIHAPRPSHKKLAQGPDQDGWRQERVRAASPKGRVGGGEGEGGVRSRCSSLAGV